MKDWFRRKYYPDPSDALDTSGQIYYYNNLKGFLIIVVLIGHFVNPITSADGAAAFRAIYMFIYSFHMPMFIFVTGFFAKSIISREKRFKSERIVQMLAIYVFMTVVIWLINNYLRGVGSSIYNPFQTVSPAWYMMSTATWYMSIPFMKNARPWAAIGGTVIFAVIAGFYTNINDFLSISRTICFFPFFLVGFYLDKEKINRFLDWVKPYIRIICILLLFALLIYCFLNLSGIYKYRSIISPHYPYPEGYKLLFATRRFLWYGVASVIGATVMLVIPRCKSIFTLPGVQTLTIFVWHAIIIRLLNFAGFFDYIAANAGNVLIVIMTVVSSILLAYILSLKIFEVPLRIFTRSKYGFI